MFWANASCVLVLLVAALAFYSITRRLGAALAFQRELETKLGELKSLLATARDTTAQLEAAIRRAQALPPPLQQDTLAAIEGLADPTALADARSLTDLAAHLPIKASNVAADIFEQDGKALSVARLCDQGLSPADISRRLALPVGEVEFLLSLRPASQA